MGLPAGRGSRFRPPRRNGRVGEPDGQAAAPPQCSVILRPVRDPIPGSRNMMTVFGLVFERHGSEFPVVDEASLPSQVLADNPADPCNNVTQARPPCLPPASRITLPVSCPPCKRFSVMTTRRHLRNASRSSTAVISFRSKGEAQQAIVGHGDLAARIAARINSTSNCYGS